MVYRKIDENLEDTTFKCIEESEIEFNFIDDTYDEMDIVKENNEKPIATAEMMYRKNGESIRASTKSKCVEDSYDTFHLIDEDDVQHSITDECSEISTRTSEMVYRKNDGSLQAPTYLNCIEGSDPDFYFNEEDNGDLSITDEDNDALTSSSNIIFDKISNEYQGNSVSLKGKRSIPSHDTTFDKFHLVSIRSKQIFDLCDD